MRQMLLVLARTENIAAASLFEMSLGAAIGAITFTGSIIAFLKLDGRMSGAPIMLPGASYHQWCASGLNPLRDLFL